MTLTSLPWGQGRSATASTAALLQSEPAVANRIFMIVSNRTYRPYRTYGTFISPISPIGPVSPTHTIINDKINCNYYTALDDITIALILFESMATEFSKDLLLRDGAALRVRSMRRDDRQALKDLFARCSPESIRFRFLHQVKELTEDMLDRLTDTDSSGHVALVVAQGEGRDERVVAVGRYQVEEERPGVAEVSFLVEDAMQRRGIGTLLLDALAELARERGVTRFSADVLADNRQMLSVFRKAGYGLSATTSYGVTQLEFPIAQTELAQARAEAQEAEAERASLAHLLAPKSIAVVGASRNPNSVGGALFQNLIRWRFTGVVYPINPSAKSVAGVRAYAEIKEAPETPELVFVAVPAHGVLDAARQCVGRNANAGDLRSSRPARGRHRDQLRIRGARVGAAQPARPVRPGRFILREHRQSRRRFGQRPAAILGDRRRDGRDSALPRELR